MSILDTVNARVAIKKQQGTITSALEAVFEDIQADLLVTKGYSQVATGTNGPLRGWAAVWAKRRSQGGQHSAQVKPFPGNEIGHTDLANRSVEARQQSGTAISSLSIGNAEHARLARVHTGLAKEHSQLGLHEAASVHSRLANTHDRIANPDLDTRGASAYTKGAALHDTPTATTKEHLDHALVHAKLANEFAKAGDFTSASRHMKAAKQHQATSKLAASRIVKCASETDYSVYVTVLKELEIELEAEYERYDYFRVSKGLEKSEKHPGFAKVSAAIEAKTGVSADRADAILASATRNASTKAKKRNPNLTNINKGWAIENQLRDPSPDSNAGWKKQQAIANANKPKKPYLG